MKGFIIYLIIGLMIIVAQEIIVTSVLYGIRNFKTVFKYTCNAFKTEMWKLDTIEKVITYAVIILLFLVWPIMIIWVVIRNSIIIRRGQWRTIEQIISEDEDES